MGGLALWLWRPATHRVRRLRDVERLLSACGAGRPRGGPAAIAPRTAPDLNCAAFSSFMESLRASVRFLIETLHEHRQVKGLERRLP